MTLPYRFTARHARETCGTLNPTDEEIKMMLALIRKARRRNSARDANFIYHHSPRAWIAASYRIATRGKETYEKIASAVAISEITIRDTVRDLKKGGNDDGRL